jgi:hypothetical protein
MPKVRAHLRVAKTQNKYRVNATSRPAVGPLTDVRGEPLATVAFAIDLVIPDEAFKQAARVIAEVEIPADALRVDAEVRPVT